MRVFIFQPALPKYRLDFFERIDKLFNRQLSVYYSETDLGILTKINEKYKWAIKLGKMKKLFPGFYWQLNLLSVDISSADCIVVCGNPRNLSTIILLIKAIWLKKQTIWWGQYWSSTSVKYRQFIRIYISKLASSLLFYTDREVFIFKRNFPNFNRSLGALNNGIDISKISQKRYNYSSKNRPLNILFIGRLTKKANLNLLIECLNMIKLKSYGLDIIGDGNEYKEIFNRVRDYKLDHVVRFHGGLTDEDLISKIANECAVFVYPGSVGLSLIHAMAYGLPAIVHSNELHHMPEIAAFENNITGLNFKENSARDLSNVLVKLMDSEEHRERMSINSISKLKENFNTESMSKRFHEFVQKNKY